MTTVQLKPPATMLIGATGTGKTYSITSMLRAGLEVFVLVTEPTGVETLIDACHEQKLDMSKLHWKLVKPASDSLEVLLRQAEISNRKSAGDMQKMETGLAKDQHQQYLKFLQACQNFTCDRDGKEYGDITTWGPDRALVVDSLSGVNVMVSRNQCGNRLTMTQPEFGICQNILENLLNALTGLDCFFVLCVHPEYERDEVEGTNRVMASTLGKKLAPKIPRFFSEIIWTFKDDKRFLWSTMKANVDTKNRILPIANDLKPTFAPVVEGYNLRLKLMEVKNESVETKENETEAA